MTRLLRWPFLVALAAALVTWACSSGSSSSSSSSSSGASGSGSSGSATSGSSGAASGGPGFDCPALRDKQAAANCPKFDGAQYLTSCEDTKSKASASCKPLLDAFANCVLGQTFGCTDAGTLDDTTPPACKPQEDAVTSGCK